MTLGPYFHNFCRGFLTHLYYTLTLPAGYRGFLTHIYYTLSLPARYRGSLTHLDYTLSLPAKRLFVGKKNFKKSIYLHYVNTRTLSLHRIFYYFSSGFLVYHNYVLCLSSECQKVEKNI